MFILFFGLFKNPERQKRREERRASSIYKSKSRLRKVNLPKITDTITCVYQESVTETGIRLFRRRLYGR